MKKGESFYDNIKFYKRKNKNKQSFLNTKITKYTISQEEYAEGREVFLRFVKPINEKSLYNYFKECEEVRS
ncbi:spermidine acetyltransferase [Clostridium botulinum]|uniref:Putative aBC transporter, ATP-binding protein n=1 Tax=Clostridium botulinum TaxID=1491 RepID=A0A1L7JMA4_CLOBO|nr:spermidine acetyltransferase [Clostridium botulinum]APU86908.1 putative aBC transporter, ATP-binding protein [Clostridium botulinum]